MTNGTARGLKANRRRGLSRSKTGHRVTVIAGAELHGAEDHPEAPIAMRVRTPLAVVVLAAALAAAGRSVRRPVDAFVQGVIADRGAPNGLAAVTNGVAIEVR